MKMKPSDFTHVFISLSLSSSEGKTPASESKNGKRERGGGGGGSKPSMLTWLLVLALLGLWSSMAVLYLDVVDYDSVIGNWLFVFGFTVDAVAASNRKNDSARCFCLCL